MFPSVRPNIRQRTMRSRIVTIFACLALLGLAAAIPSALLKSATAQKAAKRVATPASRGSRVDTSRTPLRRSRDSQVISQSRTNADGSIVPGQVIAYPVQRSMSDIMADQLSRPQAVARRHKPEFEGRNERQLPDGPGALQANQWPLLDKSALASQPEAVQAPQTLGTQFDGATGPTETGAFPPDTMGAVGPTQFFVFLNGRMRTFNKTTGVADGVINADPDVFFASVITPPGAGEVSFTSDPQVRFDRLTNRWFLVIIDVVLDASTGATTKANRVLVAVNDAASNGTISVGTIWTLYQFQGDATLFTDYESLGIDASALYVGGDMFTLAGAFNSTKGLVIPKAPALTASPLTVWAFSGLVATPTGAGPFAPRGVDNYNPANTGATAEGYFIGVDNATFNTLMLRRVTNPGSLGPAPTISANISIATPLTTRFPVLVPHLGNTAGTGGRLDSLDDRLYAAHLRNGRLWTAHSIGVNNTGVAGATNNRDAGRWYELQNVITPGTPSVLQSGTLFDNNATNDANQRNYWIPTITVSGQGHAALGCSIAGTSERVNAFTTGRLTGDTLGQLRDGPGGAALPGYTASATAYNPPGDPGGPSRRWGDYSFTSLDPKDDMTIWTIQEYCNGTNTYGVRAVKLIAPPPPPTNTASPAAIQLNNPSTNVVVTGLAPAGQGYYDPGPDPAAPHTPFTHLSATGAGVIVNSVTYNTPTQVTLNLSTVGSTPGSKTITIKNPDGQTTTVQVLSGPTAAPATISGRVITSDGAPVSGVVMSLSGANQANSITDNNGNYRLSNIETGSFYTITPELANFHFSPANRSFSLVGDKTDATFTAAADAAIVANAIDTSEYFVRQQYLDFLGREPDAGGFNYWRDQANSCNGDADCVRTKRIDVSAAFFLSQEFKDTGSFVYRLYKGALGRQLRYSEFSADRAQVVGSPNLESSKTSFADAFVQRAEFTDKYQGRTTAETFVDALLQTMNDSSGVNQSSARAALISRYNEGAGMNASRALVVRQLVDNDTFAGAVYNQQFVAMQYFGYLRRSPDADGFNFWLNVLNNDASNYRGMVCSFITSAEYQRRFGTMVSHSNSECGR
ncbi:MAG: hypothetical protein JWM21_4455 [Acidobacteria bacterium]|nr:hypothetical protein [Acidobacteriota bacterium]